MPVETEIKGVLFSLHGCLQLTKEWGFPSETCPECSGETPPHSGAVVLHRMCALQVLRLSS